MRYRILRLLAALPLVLVAAGAHAATISTLYSGTVSGSFPGPFLGGETVSVSFDWDSTAPFDGQQTASRTFWDNAATNLVLDIDGYQVSGTGYVRNLDNTTDDQMEVRFGSVLGTPYGTVVSAPSINGFDFYGFDLNFRSAGNLMFPGGDTTSLLTALPNDVTADITIRFRNQADQTFSNIINVQNEIFIMSEAEVPAPAAATLVLLGVLGLRLRGLLASSR